eukprot:1136849-Pelagomonas_calceolata.AAC.2
MPNNHWDTDVVAQLFCDEENGLEVAAMLSEHCVQEDLQLEVAVEETWELYWRLPSCIFKDDCELLCKCGSPKKTAVEERLKRLKSLILWSVYILKECEGHCLALHRGDIVGWWTF